MPYSVLLRSMMYYNCIQLNNQVLYVLRKGWHSSSEGSYWRECNVLELAVRISIACGHHPYTAAKSIQVHWSHTWLLLACGHN